MGVSVKVVLDKVYIIELVRSAHDENYDLVIVAFREAAERYGLHVLSGSGNEVRCKIGFLPRWLGRMQADVDRRYYDEIEFVNAVNMGLCVQP